MPAVIFPRQPVKTLLFNIYIIGPFLQLFQEHLFPWFALAGVQVHLGSVGFSWDGGVHWEAGRPRPAWSTLGPLCSQKWWARKRPAALAANHGLIFKFVAQDPRIRTHHSGRDKN